MKSKLCFIFIFLSLLSNAQIISIKDLKNIPGFWQGKLTYLDYNSGKPYSMPVNLEVEPIAGTNNLLLSISYPDEPNANGMDTLFISKNRKFINASAIVRRQELPNKTALIVTRSKGRDGNDNSEVLIRYSYTIGPSEFKLKKEVQLLNDTTWIKRNEFIFSRTLKKKL
ncbi:hypothetical protein [Gaetbulibacter aestuarii]|uniref:Uncharacterized protein n=1 Tax=Gaetbulibacter aestuarii TaxID=1502358 RepID=A0ABW7MV27_9FLAO